jgi:hypothetical protein
MRARKHLAWTLILGGLYGLLLAGCSTRVGGDIKIPMGELALHDSVPKAESIAKLERHINEAKSDNMPFLAPHYFREASDKVSAIKQASPGNVSALDLATADAILDKGEAVSAIVRNRFARELELKANLEKSRANEIYSWKHKMIMYDFSGLIEKVELDNSANIERDREALNKSMQDLYNKTLQYTASHESHIDNDAKDKDDKK